MGHTFVHISRLAFLTRKSQLILILAFLSAKTNDLETATELSIVVSTMIISHNVIKLRVRLPFISPLRLKLRMVTYLELAGVIRAILYTPQEFLVLVVPNKMFS